MPAMLIWIAVRMLLVPRPGCADDLFQLGKLRFPAKFLERPLGRSDETWWIAGAARLFDKRNFFLRYFLAHIDDLAHRIPGAVAEVVKTLLAGLQRENVRLR